MNKFLEVWKKFWKFLKKDSWQSWLVSLVIAFVLIKFVFFPLLSFITGSPLPLVVVESCSMYHSIDNFDNWWDSNSVWYEDRQISKEEFGSYKFKNGLNKGDIILVWGRTDYDVGDVLIFEAGQRFPLIQQQLKEVDFQ